MELTDCFTAVGLCESQYSLGVKGFSKKYRSQPGLPLWPPLKLLSWLLTITEQTGSGDPVSQHYSQL